MQKLIQKLFMLTLFGVILTALSSCESIRLAGAGSWSPGKNYHVTLGRSWSVLSERTDKGAPLKILTIDGPGLNMLIVLDGIKAGDSYLIRCAGISPYQDLKPICLTASWSPLSRTAWQELG